MCTNSVAWFCAYLCKTEDTVNYACCNIWCTTCSLLWPLSANISKSAHKFLSFAFTKKNPSIVHILKTQLVSMYHQLYFLPPLSCFHAHLLALSHIYIYKERYLSAITKLYEVEKVLCCSHQNISTRAGKILMQWPESPKLWTRKPVSLQSPKMFLH